MHELKHEEVNIVEFVHEDECLVFNLLRLLVGFCRVALD